MPHVRVDGAEIHYSVQGQGETTLLLLIGLGAQAREWGEVFPGALAQHFRVVRMDNRGIGESRADQDAWTMADMANDACAVLDAVGVRSAHLLGISMGGMIAQVVAIEHPERVRRLILMSTHFGGAETVRPKAEVAALFLPVAGASPSQAWQAVLEGITGPGFAAKNRAVIAEKAALRELYPTSGRLLATQVRAIATSDRSQTVAGIRQPTLVIHGTDDPLVPVQNGKLLAERIPGARLVLLPGCGHLPHFEQPTECTQAVVDFLTLD
jgi:3-oxoadipate enol-lactonase